MTVERVVTGLHALWRADRADGGIRPGHNTPALSTWHDYSGNGRHATITNIVERSADGPHLNADSDAAVWRDIAGTYQGSATLNGFSFSAGSGWAGGGTAPHELTFDGAGDYVSLPGGLGGLGNTVGFSLEYWLYVRSAGTWNTLLTEFGTYTTNGMRIGFDVNRHPVVWATQNGGTFEATSSEATLPLNEWVHLAITWAASGAGAIAYINGVAYPLTGSGTSVAASLTATIGADIGGGSFAGSLSGFRCYSGVMTPAEVASSYALGPSSTSLAKASPSCWLQASRAVGPAGWTEVAGVPALAFDGANDYVSLPAINVASDGEGTCEGWYRATVLKTAYILSMGDGSAGQQFAIAVSSSNRPVSVVRNSASSTVITPSSGTWATVYDGRWHHIACVYGGGYNTCYYDGAAIGSAAVVSGTQSLDRGSLGRRDGSSPGAYFRGDIALGAVYERALSAAEIAQNFAAGPALPVSSSAVYIPASISEAVVAPAQTVAVSCEAISGGSSIAELSIVGGSVTADARRSVFRDATLELVPADGETYADLFGMLAAPGVELAVSRGFVLADGSELTAALGRFVVEDLALRESGSGTTLSVTCADLSVRISRARWTDPYRIVAGTKLATAIAELLASRWSSVRISIDPAMYPETLGAQVILEAGDASDPWADACRIAEAFGYALVFDTSGVAVLVPAPDLSASPVFLFARGETAIVTERTRTAALSRMYNGVIATGEGTDVATPVRGEAWDLNPASPTYRYGPLGQVPMFYSSPLLTTAAQAETAAATLLAGVIGRAEQLSWAQVVHPGLAPLDVVQVELEDGSLRSYVLDSVTIPLDPAGVMQAVTREISEAY